MMQYNDFVQLVSRMRDAQKAFFRGRTSMDLSRSKQLEKQCEQKPTTEIKSAEESLGIDSDTYNKIVDECIYGDDEQKPFDKVEPKFKVGDVMRTLQEAADGMAGGMPVIISIDKEYYHCTNELIAIKDQDEYEYPPMNRRIAI